MEPSVAAISAVRGGVAAAMRAEMGHRPGWAWHDDVATDDFVAAVRRHRVAEVLAGHDDELGLPEQVSREVRRLRDEARLESMLQARELIRVTQLLSAAGVRHLTFKGPALAHQTTGDFTARGAGDLDLLVDPSTVARAHELLVAHGWAPVERFPVPGPSWAWRHLLSTYYQLPLVGEHSTVDLHWWLDPGHAALPDFATAWHRRDRVSVAGTEVETLSAADALTHACSHAAKDDWRWLRSLVDVHRLARRSDVWGPGTELSRVDALSLAATSRAIGLPDTVPGWASRRLDRVSERTLARARSAQERPLHGPRDDLVGAGMRSALPRYLHGRKSPGDVTRILYDAVLPGAQLGAITDRRAVTAVPRATLHRLGVAAAKVRRARDDGTPSPE